MRVRFVPSAALFVLAAFAPATDLGTLVHFPNAQGTDAEWNAAEAATAEAAEALGKGAWLRFDALWHEANWSPDAPAGTERLERILALLRKHDLRPMMDFIPHPWPGSEWDKSFGRPDNWGAPKPASYALIAKRTRELIAGYRAALPKAGFDESRAAIQFGNEPASGHPGGDAKLPEGTWSGAGLWREIQKGADYGRLTVLSPALSMQDHAAAVADRERKSARAGAEAWQAPVTGWTFHHRVHRPDLSGEAYATEYVRVLAARARLVQSVWAGLSAEGGSREAWVTEGYVAVGDAGGDRAEAVEAVVRKLKAGVPGVKTFILYRWYPKVSGGVDWTFGAKERAAIRAALRGS